MSRIHDLGGMRGFGPVVVDPEDAPAFHAEWEARVFALMRSLVDQGLFLLDEVRHAIERMPPAAYLDASYYERWLVAIETLLVEKGHVPEAELRRS